MCIKGWDVVILTERPLYIEELEIHVTVNLGGPRPVRCCAALCCTCGVAFRPVLCCEHPVAA